jgi:hypothetical protein
MTAIEGVGRPTATRPAARASGSTTAEFSVPPETPGASQPTPAAAPAPASSLASMLTLQEMGDASVADREARRQGQTMLAVLAELQRALLVGADPAATLAQLADLTAAAPRAVDPQLAAVLSAIRLRVRVELARRQR